MKYAVNQKFIHTIDNDEDEEYTIKGAWDDKYPENSHAFLMRSDGTGHVYVGKVTHVNNVWDITEEEFIDMCGGRTEWFIIKPNLKHSLELVKHVINADKGVLTSSALSVIEDALKEELLKEVADDNNSNTK